MSATATLKLSLLGTFDVIHDGVPVTNFRGDKVRALLAFLATTADRPHTRAELAALLWPEQGDQAALGNLSQTLLRLRSALGDSAGESQLLLISRASIQWRSDVACLDVADFTRLARSANHDDLARAAALYRGEFMQGFDLPDSLPFAEWLLITREQLHLQALATLFTLTSHYLEQARWREAIAAAQRQIDLEPWREVAHRQLMQALAESGDRAGAQAQFARCRKLLADELGVEPDGKTRALYESLLAGGQTQVKRDTAAPRHNLPAALTSFVGRETELRAITEFKQTGARLLTLVGAGGMGKTRLALEAARASIDAYADGVFFVPLAPLAVPEAIVSAIDRALGMPLHGSDPTAALLHWVQDKHLLLILDNFEHLLDGVGLVVELLQAAPRLQIITTSRERLNVRGEQLYSVEGLECGQGAAAAEPSSAAMRMFVQGARRAAPGFQLNAVDLPALRRICEFVGGMPLGLELAAAWVGLLPLQAIANEITRDVDFLEARWPDAPERQRSMRAVFDWSWRLLSDAERKVLRQLSVIRGSFTREAAETIAGATLRVLASLHQKSLLHQRPVESGAWRYEIHELLRQFGAEQLEAVPDERVAVTHRHGVYYLQFVAMRTGRLVANEPREASAEIRAEIDNVRQAWSWGVHERQVAELARAAHCWWRFCQQNGLYLESERTFELAAGCCRSVLQTIRAHDPTIPPPPGLSTLLAIYADHMFNNVPFEQMAAEAREAICLGVASGDLEGETMGSFVLGRALQELGRQGEAREMWEHAIELSRAYGPRRPDSELLPDIEWMACLWLIGAATFFEDYQAARAWAQKCLGIAQSRRKRLGYVASLSNLAKIDMLIGNDVDVRERLEEVLQLSRETEDRGREITVQRMLSELLRLQGAYSEALPLLLTATRQAREVNDLYAEIYTLAGLLRLACELGDLTNAARWRSELSDRVDRPGITLDCQTTALRAYALFALQCGTHQQALTHAEHAVRVSAEIDIPNNRAESALILAHVQAAMNDPHAASEQYEEALGLYLRIGNLALASEPRAGLAQLAFARGALETACTFVDALLPLHTARPRAGVLTPFFIDLVCYRVLAASADPRAVPILQTSQQRLRACADQIPDHTLRASFLDKPLHRELLTLRPT